MCDEGILAECQLHRCLQLFAPLRKYNCQQLFVLGILTEPSKLRNIPSEVGITALQLSSGYIDSGRIS